MTINANIDLWKKKIKIIDAIITELNLINQKIRLGESELI